MKIKIKFSASKYEDSEFKNKLSSILKIGEALKLTSFLGEFKGSELLDACSNTKLNNNNYFSDMKKSIRSNGKYLLYEGEIITDMEEGTWIRSYVIVTNSQITEANLAVKNAEITKKLVVKLGEGLKDKTIDIDSVIVAILASKDEKLSSKFETAAEATRYRYPEDYYYNNIY